MSALDEITKEKQRVSEALARVDAQREKLAGQLSELEAANYIPILGPMIGRNAIRGNGSIRTKVASCRGAWSAPPV